MLQIEKKYEAAAIKFNMKPKKGIAYLVEQGLCDGTPQSVASFLFQSRGVDKVIVGDYIGDPEDFNKKVRVIAV